MTGNELVEEVETGTPSANSTARVELIGHRGLINAHRASPNAGLIRCQRGARPHVRSVVSLAQTLPFVTHTEHQW